MATSAAVAAGIRIALAAPMLAVTRPPEVQLRLLELTITPTELRGRQVFRNTASRDIGAIVAFTAPDLDAASPGFGYLAIPRPEELNFMDISASVGGRPVSLQVEARAYGAGLDRTPLLEDLGVPLAPASEAAWRALGRLTPAAVADLFGAGLIDVEQIGAVREPRPRWLLRTTWHWPQLFPAGEEVTLEWRRQLSVGAATPAVASLRSPAAVSRQQEYCATVATAAASAIAAGNGPGNDWLHEQTANVHVSTGPAFAGPADMVDIRIEAGDRGLALASCFPGLTQEKPGVWRARRQNVVMDEPLKLMWLAPGQTASQGAPPAEE